jgi:hypothetical protein
VVAAIKLPGPIVTRLPRRVVVIAAAAALILAAAALVVTDSSALGAGPALVLLAVLALRCYPGERVLAVLMARRGRQRARARTSSRLPPSADIAPPRGGLLLARSLAVRPPPAALAAS